jgi:nicotinamide-nucleotide amidase
MALDDIEEQADKAAARLVERLSGGRYSLALAESCTAGLVSDLIARVSGASNVFWGSFVCYSPGAKKLMLRIDGDFLEKHGLVSAETAGKMALNALELSGATIGAAVTGLAGPFGDGSETPVGTVYVAVARRDGGVTADVESFFFSGTRAEIRIQAAKAVIEQVLEIINNEQRE